MIMMRLKYVFLSGALVSIIATASFYPDEVELDDDNSDDILDESDLDDSEEEDEGVKP
ncbi:hypothetical protein X975_00289, partial [Stegodyphus mimosarum]